jgi:hypothetical protein
MAGVQTGSTTAGVGQVAADVESVLHAAIHPPA